MAGHYQRSGNRRGRRGNNDQPATDADGQRTYSPNQAPGIPYIEANPDTGEMPLDHIDTFVVPGRDEKGAFNKVTFQLPPWMLQQAQIICNSRRFPYLEVGDMVRHALARHIKFCVNIRQSLPPSIVSVLEAMMEASRHNDLRIRSHEAYVEIEKQISRCMVRGETMEAVRMINVILQMLQGVPTSPAITGLTKRLQDQFNYVIGTDGKLRSKNEK